MAGSKHFERIAWTVTALILVITILFMNSEALGIEIMVHAMGYEERLFDDTSVHTIEIVMDDWDEFIANAASEEYYEANVVIDGEAYKNVGIRAKGNTSLSTVATMGSDRYSFKIEFDQYDSTKSYHGLDKLSLNNLIQDSTMMKDYLVYQMMDEFGVNAPLCSFAYITVNDEEWGLYLAVEGVEEAFLERNYGSDYGELYKPDSMSFGGGRGNGQDFDMGNLDFNFSEGSTDSSNSDSRSSGFAPPSMPENGEMPDMSSFGNGEAPPEFDPADIPEDFDPSALGESGEKGRFTFEGGFGMGSSDVKLQYSDDQLESYSNIWDNAKTDITESDQKRLIQSLKKLSEGEDLESVVDVEQVIRYFVVHNFVCNQDSYTGAMVHNYYLYEENGKMAMIPWDYNLAFGTFQGGNAQNTVNTPIDSPIEGGSGEDRPMWSWIVSDEEYTKLYHQYFEEFLNSIDIQSMIDKAYDLIQSYVEKDPTAFYTYEEFELGVETLRQFCILRSKSISMQLENGETDSNMNYADASDISLSDMGSMGGTMGGGDMPEGFDPSDMPENFTGDFPKSSSADQTEEKSSDNQTEMKALNDETKASAEQTESKSPDRTATMGDADINRLSDDTMQRSSESFSFDRNHAESAASNLNSWIWIGASTIILIAGLITAKKYKG